MGTTCEQCNRNPQKLAPYDAQPQEPVCKGVPKRGLVPCEGKRWVPAPDSASEFEQVQPSASVSEQVPLGTQSERLERRIDPSDGNGPYTKAEFVAYYGEEEGNAIW